MENIVLHVTYTCLPGKAEEFVKALKESGIQESVRAEDGCLQYDYFLSQEEKDTVLLLEKWQDKDALAAHGARPCMAAIGKEKEGRVLEARVERYE